LSSSPIISIRSRMAKSRCADNSLLMRARRGCNFAARLAPSNMRGQQIEHAESIMAARTNQGVRLNKIIADSGIASRRAADQLILEGRVKINGVVVTELGTRVHPSQRVHVDGKIIGDPERLVYILLNKPKDTITTTSDECGRRTVMDLINYRER